MEQQGLELPLEDTAGLALEDAGIDWNNPDQVAGHVSKLTMAGMQQQWRAHAAAMDTHGRSFAEVVYSLHAHALKDLASMKTFEVKTITALLNSFTSGIRKQVLNTFQVMRQADDQFAQALYQTSRKAFTRNLREALDTKDRACADKIKRLQVVHEQELATQRSAAVVQRQQDNAAMRIEVTRELKADNRKKLAEAITGITNTLNQQYAAQYAAAIAAATQCQPCIATVPPTPGATTPGATPGATPAVTEGGAVLTPATTIGGAVPESATNTAPATPRHSSLLAVPQQPPVAALPPPQLVIDLTGTASVGGAPGGFMSTGPGISLEMLQALAQQDDDTIGSVLAKKEMEASVRTANQRAEELTLKVEELSLNMQQLYKDTEAWKDKWAQENAKTDGIKRECLQVIIKCEKKVKSLQEEHLAEMQKRDTIMARSRDTIMRLEARVAELSGQPQVHPHLVPFSHLQDSTSGNGAKSGEHSPAAVHGQADLSSAGAVPQPVGPGPAPEPSLGPFNVISATGAAC